MDGGVTTPQTRRPKAAQGLGAWGGHEGRGFESSHHRPSAERLTGTRAHAVTRSPTLITSHPRREALGACSFPRAGGAAGLLVPRAGWRLSCLPCWGGSPARLTPACASVSRSPHLADGTHHPTEPSLTYWDPHRQAGGPARSGNRGRSPWEGKIARPHAGFTCRRRACRHVGLVPFTLFTC